MSSTRAVQAHVLGKVYGDTVAVDDLCLQVDQGEVFGFLGPNGAGKTTSVKMLLGLVHPTSGEARLLGIPCSDPASRRQVGFLPEHFRFQEWMRATEFLEAHGRLCGMARSDCQSRGRELLDLVGLGYAAQRRLAAFSKGMLQRIGLAQALMHRPRLVFLDEPTSGLDPLGRRMVRDVISELAAEGVTVFLNSHLLGEVEATCTRVAFIKSGRVVATESLTEISQTCSRVTVEVGTLSPGLEAELRALRPEAVCDPEGRLHVRVADKREIGELVDWLVNRRVPVFAVLPQGPTLEDLFVEVMSKGDAE